MSSAIAANEVSLQHACMRVPLARYRRPNHDVRHHWPNQQRRLCVEAEKTLQRRSENNDGIDARREQMLFTEQELASEQQSEEAVQKDEAQ